MPIISISYILWLLAARGEKSGGYKARQGGISKPALLCRDYPKFVILQAAIKEFGDLLPWYKRFFFYKAWVRYYCCTGRNVDKNCQVYHHYMASIGSSYDGKKYKEHDNAKSYQENFKKNIDKLLSYAKAK